MSLVIFTHPADFHSIMLSLAAKSLSVSTIRIFPHLIPYSKDTEINFDSKFGLQLYNKGYLININDCVFWLRRLIFIDNSQTLYNKMDKHYIESYNTFLKNLYYFISLKYKSINNMNSREMARKKAIQLHFASICGLNVPKTLFTDNYYSAKKFIKINKDNFIFKPIASPYLNTGNSKKAIYARKINHFNLDKEMLKCPYIYQNYIDKDFDIRIVAFGDKFIGARIDSDNKYIDYKENYYKNINVTKFLVDKDLKKKCINMMKKIGITFCIFDFVCDKYNNIWFLELNESAQFLFLEHICYDIKLLDVLLSFLTFYGNPFEFSKNYNDNGVRYYDFYDSTTLIYNEETNYDYSENQEICIIS